MTPAHKTSGKCPIAYALDIFGDRWSLLIVRDMLFRNKCHFGEFTRSAEKISTNILTARLTRLEAAGIITRDRDPENLTRVVYSLTPKGLDLIPVILELIVWSARYDPPTDGPMNIIHGAPPDLLPLMDTDRDGLIAELRAGLVAKRIGQAG